MRIVDTETCGLHGMPVLLQWAELEGPTHLHDIWRVPIIDTLKIIEEIAEEGIIGFNLAFDAFHLCKVYTTFSMYPDKEAYPEDIIDELGLLEKEARFGPCLKFKHCLDLMLYSRKGPFQALMARDDIKIRRVPVSLAFELARELEARVKIDDIFFSGKKNQFAPKWNVYEHKNKTGQATNPEFRDVVLKFQASGRLKTLAGYIGLATNDDIIKFGDIAVQPKFNPVEVGYAPFALAISKPERNWKCEDGFAWPGVIEHHINHWGHNERARKYAGDDITYTRGLYNYFGCPKPDDDDSILACMVAAVRWRGYDIDIEGLKACRDDAAKIVRRAPKAPRRVREYIYAAMNDTEKVVLSGSTKKVVLDSIAKWKLNNEVEHPAAIRAKEVLLARKAEKEIELYDKLIFAGRLHASFVVIGSLSSRMSGNNDLNVMAINHSKFVRKNFSFCSGDYKLGIGDFDSFEICLADAVYADPVMRNDLVTGVKLHAVMGAMLFDKTEDEVIATKGSKTLDMYDTGKKGNFLLIYGGNENTFENKLSVTLEKGIEAFKRFFNRYKVFGSKRQQKLNRFCSMTQPGGIGSQVIWNDPPEYAESLFGFKRFFTLENSICKELFNLAQNPPKRWKDIKIKVQRREGRIQTASGAVQSALYASAFGLQGSCMRAALNHEIQSSGAQITKKMQKNIWDIQPYGVHEFIVQPAQCHDECITPVKIGYEDQVHQAVQKTIDSYKDKVPLLKMEFKIGVPDWSSK